MSFVRVTPSLAPQGWLAIDPAACGLVPAVAVREPNTLSKSVDVCSREVSAVCDLELRLGPVIRGRPRTAANETRTETGAASVPNPSSRRK